jgi:hypothetical protein
VTPRAEGRGHDVARLVGQADVVQREVERASCLAQKGGDALGHLERRLAPGRECVDLD